MRMRVATWNIACGAKGFHGSDPAGLASAISELSADVCCLQEVDRFARRSGGIDFPAFLMSETGMYGVYCPSVTFASDDGVNVREYGNMLLSRFALDGVSFARFDDAPVMEGSVPAERETRTAIIALVKAPTPFWVACTHLAYSPGLAPSVTRLHQIERLLEAVRVHVPATAPFVLLGDFNTAAESPEIKSLRSEFRMETETLGPTWPIGGKFPGHRSPFVAIDHILTRDIGPADVGKLDYPALSDHSLVFADIAMGGG